MYKSVKFCSGGILLMAVMLLLASCSSAPLKHKTDTVEIKDMKFVPDDITVKKGDTILWINKDIVEHDVTETTSKVWTSGPIPLNGSWKMVITDDADYYCSIHLVMKGKLRVGY